VILEEQIYARLVADATITGALAEYNSAPAIFKHQAPKDTDTGWGASQYPRIVYGVQRSEARARRRGGRMMIEVFADDPAALDVLEPAIRASLDASIYHPVNESVVAVLWTESREFQQQRESETPDDLINGTELEFELITFPTQLTFDPDPIAIVNAAFAADNPDFQVDPPNWSPVDDEPAIYWRVASLVTGAADMMHVWSRVTVILRGHVISPDEDTMVTFLRKAHQWAALKRFLIFPTPDGTPLNFGEVRLDVDADPFRDGQIAVTAEFGVLQAPSTSELLNEIGIGVTIE